MEIKTELLEKRDSLIGKLKTLEKEKIILLDNMQFVKDEIRQCTDDIITEYQDKFRPGTTWMIDNGDELEYFKVNNCTLDHYDYRNEDIGDCSLDINCSYMRVPSPWLDGFSNINTQYKKSDCVILTIHEVNCKVSEVSVDDWNDVLKSIFDSEKIV